MGSSGYLHVIILVVILVPVWGGDPIFKMFSMKFSSNGTKFLGIRSWVVVSIFFSLIQFDEHIFSDGLETNQVDGLETNQVDGLETNQVDGWNQPGTGWNQPGRGWNQPGRLETNQVDDFLHKKNPFPKRPRSFLPARSRHWNFAAATMLKEQQVWETQVYLQKMEDVHPYPRRINHGIS